MTEPGLPDEPRCGRTPVVPPEMAETVRTILGSEGGTASSDTSCLRHPDHPDHADNPHYSLLADLGAKDGGAWTLWRGPNLLLVLLPWCTTLEDEPCLLFHGHPGPCPSSQPSG
ncbi:hypothetical protein [Streptomyces catenulae]|uniref:Uncharacterized protein n=1 Tax=Streptomyces catenulae TaxID=66875 RepID=A0ABV2Z4I2_9ACTN|nr:hypothetical protein [Streptomyces catenulae]